MSAGEWIAHDGKGMPVAGDVMVLCRFADGTDEELKGDIPSRADYWDDIEPFNSNWVHGEGSDDCITHYKVVAHD